MIKSPLRYPGGKSKAVKEIELQLPEGFLEFREPFVGGGSVFIYLKQKYPYLKIWINDLNPELYLFWKHAKHSLPHMIQQIYEFKEKYTDGRILFKELISVDSSKLSEVDRAVRFFILNRITFSGTVDSGGFSEQAFKKRFTDSSIDRLRMLGDVLTDDIKITNLDYSDLIKPDSKDVFIFLDPPYFSATKSKLYGKNGDLHTCFDHRRFSELVKGCDQPWLITYDDSPQVRDNFLDSDLIEWELQYGMNNKKGKASKGKELFIKNYKKKY